MIKRYGDIYASLFFILTSIVIYIASFNIRMLTISKIGSAFVPKLVAVGIFLFSSFLLVMSIKRLREDEIESDKEEKQDNQPNHYFSVFGSSLLMIGYLTFMETVGFLIMTVIYLFSQMLLMSQKSNRSYLLFIVTSIISSGVIYYFFRNLFHVMLPPGFLG